MKILFPGKKSRSHRFCSFVCGYYNCGLWGNGEKLPSQAPLLKKERFWGLCRCEIVNYKAL